MIENCIRCGTCCKKGGPSLHRNDTELVENGIILAKHLYTIRKGETAFDNVKGVLIPTASDIIKIKSKKKSQECIFFDQRENRCKIYAKRPIECRVLKCWDTREIERIYSKNRLVRKELFFKIKWLWELIEMHEEKCSYEKVRHFAKDVNTEAVNKKSDSAVEKILDIFQYDLSFRSLVVEKGYIKPDMLDFLFGRPLLQTQKIFGLKVKQRDGN
ncbi:MAG: YkgJ family cysteine cluster protein [Deltaproteobacteria bacterium]|nr:MAG: YkgJ family cysteine cluster protein [Deltaproteobacteria bacterium]